jgi:hypothetical protein
LIDKGVSGLHKRLPLIHPIMEVLEEILHNGC